MSSPPSVEGGAERHPEQDHRKRPDHVERRARSPRPPSPGRSRPMHPDDHRQERGDQRRAQPRSAASCARRRAAGPRCRARWCPRRGRTGPARSGRSARRRARPRPSSCRRPTTVSVRWFLYGLGVRHVFGPQRRRQAHRTITMNSAPKASATLLRRSRRSASRHGPWPATRSARASSSNAAGPSNANSVAGSVAMLRTATAGGRRMRPPALPFAYFRQNSGQSFLYTGWTPRAVLEVHPLREERRRLLVAVRHDVRLVVRRRTRRGQPTRRRPRSGSSPRSSSIFLSSSGSLTKPWLLVGVDFSASALSSGSKKSRRVREVLVPVREPGLGLGRLRADLVEVDLLVQRLDLRLVADLVQHVGVVVGDRRARILVVGPHRDRLALVPDFSTSSLALAMSPGPFGSP